MATSDILGLFTTPQQYEQQRQAAMEAQALQQANLSPMQQGQFGIALGAQQLGRAIGGALGGVDPQLKMISQRQQLASQLDPSKPESFMQAAQLASQSGDQQFAIALADAGRQAAIQVAQANKERQLAVPADIQKIQMIPQINNAIAQYKAMPQTPEIQQQISSLESMLSVINPKPKAEATPNEIQIAQALAAEKGVKGTPEYNAEYSAQLTRLSTKDQKENIIDVGVAEKSREVVYFDKERDQQFIMKPDATGKLVRTPYSGGIDKTTAKVSASSTSQQETEFSKDLGKADAERVKNAMITRENSIGTLTSLNRLNQLNQQDLISGSFATGRVGATNLLSTLGLASGKDMDKLSASENYQKTAGDVILATLGGRLGSGFSNADREFIQSLVPQLENSPQARKQLIEFMVKKNQEIVDETTRLENHARDNKSLKGFVPKIPIINLETPVKPVSQMTKEELKAAIEAKKRESK